MRIRLVHISSSLRMGGAERVLYDLIVHLGNTEYEHHVIYVHGGPYEQLLAARGIKMYHVSTVGLLDPTVFFRVMKLIRTIKPDCIHTLLWAANLFGRLSAWWYGIPCVQVLHNNQELNGRLRRTIDAATLRFSDRIIAVCPAVKFSALAHHPQLARRAIGVINNGINVPEVIRLAAVQRVDRRALDLAPDAFVIGCVGRFVPVKNYPAMITFFASLYKEYPHARLVLLGIGPDEQLLRDLVDHHGIESAVRFVVGHQAYGYYPLFDCFVQPSLHEGISLALLEAMSLGLPCVVMSAHAHSVIKSGENGIVVRDMNQMARALIELMNGSGKLWASAARQTVAQEFSLERMGTEYDQLIKQLVHRNHNSMRRD